MNALSGVQTTTLVSLLLLTWSCDDAGSMGDSVVDARVSNPDFQPIEDASVPALDAVVEDATTAPKQVYTHKMIKRTGENRFAALSYECNICTFDQFLSIVVPDGWNVGPAQVLIPEGELRSTPSFDGVPDTMDFLPDVPGDEYRLIAKTVDARIVEVGRSGVVVEAQVMRDTRLRFAAGRRIHELTSPEGDVFVLFAYDVDPMNPQFPDFEAADALGEFVGPANWTYASRIIDQDLILDSQGVVTVLAIRGVINSSWERR